MSTSSSGQQGQQSPAAGRVFMKWAVGLLAVCLTLGGTFLLLRDILGEGFTKFLQDHLHGLLGGIIVLVALGCASRLRRQAPRPKVPEIDADIVKDHGEAKIEIKWLREEIEDYRAYAVHSFYRYWLFKVPTLVCAALIPVFAISKENNVIIAVLGALITICEGILHIGQFRENWLRLESHRENGTQRVGNGGRTVQRVTGQLQASPRSSLGEVRTR